MLITPQASMTFAPFHLNQKINLTCLYVDSYIDEFERDMIMLSILADTRELFLDSNCTLFQMMTLSVGPSK